MRNSISAIFAVLLLAAMAAAADEPRGWLVIEGGSNPLNPVVAQKFRELIGEADAKVLVIPTAVDDERLQRETQSGRVAVEIGRLGLHPYELFNTHDRKQADTEEFASRIRGARGIWFGGGRPGRIAEAYLGTRTQRELQSFYERGGVIGGLSAGAMIQGSFLVRGGVDDEDFHRLISQKNREGLGFLPSAVIDAHVNQRHGEGDLAEVVAAHPELLGIGLDAGTAIVVHGNQFEVIGGNDARVVITDGKEHEGRPYYFLKQGDRFDLTRRATITAPAAAPSPAQAANAAPTEAERRATEYLAAHYQAPEDYVVSKFKDHDVVFLGEPHLVRQNLLFLQKLLPRLYQAGVRNLTYEMCFSDDQAEVDRFVNAATYDNDKALDLMFRWDPQGGWAFQEYADVLRAAWTVNHGLAKGKPRFRVVCADLRPDWLLVKPGDQITSRPTRWKAWHGSNQIARNV